MTCPNCGSEKEPAGIQTLWCPDCGAEANLDDTAEFKTPEPQSNLDERIQQAKQVRSAADTTNSAFAYCTEHFLKAYGTPKIVMYSRTSF